MKVYFICQKFIYQGWRRLVKSFLPLLFIATFVTVSLLHNSNPIVAQQIPTDAPINAPTDAPINTPIDVPINAPADVPINAPADIPINVPADVPNQVPNQIPNPIPNPIPVQKPRQEIRGVWITANDANTVKDRRKVEEATSQLRRLNFNTIYPVVYNSGYVLYDSPVAKRRNIQPFVYRGLEGQDTLADIINQGHRNKLLVIPWFEFGFMTPESSELALNYPHWLTQKRDGSKTSISAAGEVAWLNPFHPEVQDFISELVLEVVTKYDADGIQFDDHMSLPWEFGYDKYTIDLYTQETGNPPPSNYQDESWIQWRANKITAFMIRLNQQVKAKKPNIIFSVSPNYYNFAYKLQLQDWLTWVRLGIVDELVMQVYRDDLESFTSKINHPEIQETQQLIPTGIGIMAGLRNRPVNIQQIQSQVRTAQQRGLGSVFFYFESLWGFSQESVTERQAGFQSVYYSPAGRSLLQSTSQDSVNLPLYSSGNETSFPGYYIDVAVGGNKSQRVVVDTGSAGLILPPSFFPNSKPPQGGQALQPFKSIDGSTLEGRLVRANIKLGTGDNSVAIPNLPVRVITKRCTTVSGKSSCSTTNLGPGIVGINYLETTATPNPLRYLPGNQNNGFIFAGNTKNPENGRNGSLIVGLTPENRAGFQFTSMTPQADFKQVPKGSPNQRWDDEIDNACLTISDTPINNQCGKIVIDSGTSTGFANFIGYQPKGMQKDSAKFGANVEIKTSNLFSYIFQLGNNPGVNTFAVRNSNGSPSALVMNTGVALYRQYDVLLDPIEGKIGFRSNNN
jgi:uncharacterized lipoprotein YddW (UPF0748 family)